MIEVIKKYEGECIIDLNGAYTFSDLVSQTNKFKNLLSNKIRNHDRVLIYSDYTFHSISLLLSLSDLNINIIPLVKTTESEYQEKVESVNPHLILSFNDENKLIIKNSKLPFTDLSINVLVFARLPILPAVCAITNFP